MDSVFILWHINRINEEDEDEKLIGVYQSEELAKAAIQRLADKPGFSKTPEGFMYDKYELNKDHWETGFIEVYGREQGTTESQITRVRRQRIFRGGFGGDGVGGF